jgi:hypothetical protein
MAQANPIRQILDARQALSDNIAGILYFLIKEEFQYQLMLPINLKT